MKKVTGQLINLIKPSTQRVHYLLQIKWSCRSTIDTKTSSVILNLLFPPIWLQLTHTISDARRAVNMTRLALIDKSMFSEISVFLLGELWIKDSRVGDEI